MSDFDALMKGMQLFNQGATKLGTSLAINKAQDQMSSINSSVDDEMAKRQQLDAVSRNLTLNLTKSGAELGQVQQAAGAIMPTPIANANGMMLQGLEKGDKKMQGMAQTQQNFEENPKMDLAQLNRDSAERIAAIGSDPYGMKAQNKANQRFSQFSNEVDPNHGGKLGVMGKLQSRVNSSQAITKLYDAVGGDPSNINMRELATGVANMFTNGSQTSVDQINHLVPNTRSGNAAKIEEWLLNEPQGAGQQAFALQYKNIAEREGALAQDQLKKAQYQKVSAFSDLQQLDPAKYDAILQSFGLSKEEHSHFLKTRELLPSTPAATEPTVPMRGPGGVIKMVPQSQVQAALRAGGTQVK